MSINKSAKPNSVPKSIFYNPLSKPPNLYNYPHSSELYAQEEKRIAEELAHKQAHIMVRHLPGTRRTAGQPKGKPHSGLWERLTAPRTAAY
jgi:hypothetical protein